MANSYYFNKFFKELKYLLLFLGVWPYEDGKASKIIRFTFIAHGLIVLILMVGIFMQLIFNIYLRFQYILKIKSIKF